MHKNRIKSLSVALAMLVQAVPLHAFDQRQLQSLSHMLAVGFICAVLLITILLSLIEQLFCKKAGVPIKFDLVTVAGNFLGVLLAALGILVASMSAGCFFSLYSLLVIGSLVFFVWKLFFVTFIIGKKELRTKLIFLHGVISLIGLLAVILAGNLSEFYWLYAFRLCVLGPLFIVLFASIKPLILCCLGPVVTVAIAFAEAIVKRIRSLSFLESYTRKEAIETTTTLSIIFGGLLVILLIWIIYGVVVLVL